jgi:hypothetical protein
MLQDTEESLVLVKKYFQISPKSCLFDKFGN